MSESELKSKGLLRLPETLPAALDALKADAIACGWFAPVFIESFVGMKAEEMKALADLDESAICERYREVY